MKTNLSQFTGRALTLPRERILPVKLKMFNITPFCSEESSAVLVFVCYQSAIVFPMRRVFILRYRCSLDVQQFNFEIYM